LAAGLVVVAAAAVMVIAVVWINGRGTSSGDGRFEGISIDTLFDQGVDEVPACFNDPVNGNRPICVFHTGDDRATGWVAYDAQVDGCAFEELSPDASELVNSCTGETYPFTGEGLPQYDTEVDDDRLVIDLDGDEPEPDDDPTTTVIESGEVPAD